MCCCLFFFAAFALLLLAFLMLSSGDLLWSFNKLLYLSKEKRTHDFLPNITFKVNRVPRRVFGLTNRDTSLAHHSFDLVSIVENCDATIQDYMELRDGLICLCPRFKRNLNSLEIETITYSVGSFGRHKGSSYRRVLQTVEC